MDASEGKDDEPVLELSKRIVARCGGLPKVIAAVAECYNKSLEKGIYLKLKAINDNFMDILEGAPSLTGLFSWTQSYLETCKDEIKPCIFYLPVFLVGQKVRSRRLLWRWTAEGYVRDTSSDTAEKNGLRLYAELMNWGIIQKQKSSKPVHYQVNGFFHQYMTSRPLEDNLCLALEGPCSLNASQRAGSPAQHLTVSSINDTDEAAFRNIDFSRLRSLTVVGKCRPFMFDPKKIKMKYVRVLDLEDASGVKYDHLNHVVEVFPRLKFLSLRGCREIRSLPKSLGGLRQLQTLDVRDTSIATLPEAILELHNLQYLRGGTRLSNPWDEGGSMVPCEPKKLVEEDPTTVAAGAPSAPAEDAATVAFAAAPATVVAADAPFRPAQDATTVAAALSTIAADAPPVPAEDTTVEAAPAAVAADAPSALAEDATTVEAAPATLAAAPATVAADALSALVEDATTVTVAVAAASTTIAADALSAPAEDGTAVAVAAALATIAADAPSTPALPAPAEDTTTIAVAAASLLASAQSPTSSVEAPFLSAAAATTGSPAPAQDSNTATSSRRRHALTIPSWLSKQCCQSRIDSNPGVEVPAGIGKLTTLHTFGVANVGTGSWVILKELPKLTELRRLSVCGVNPDNIHRFFSAISGLPHLSMLSVRLDKDKDGRIAWLDGTIDRPPKSLVLSLKLHGHVRVLADSWIKEFATVLLKLDLEVTLQQKEDMQVILGQLLHHKDVHCKSRLCLKPVYHGNLEVENPRPIDLQISILEIFCTTKLQVTFVGNFQELGVVKIHCSSESSLQLSGLEEIRYLQRVWLKGSFRADSHSLKQDLHRQVTDHINAPILMVFQPCMVQTPGVRPNNTE